MSDPATDLAIAAAWPGRWAKANDPSLPGRSKARQKLRQRYAQALKREAFIEANPHARCSSCAHSGGRQFTDALVCELDSDFHGYSVTPPDYVCTRWSAKP